MVRTQVRTPLIGRSRRGGRNKLRVLLQKNLGVSAQGLWQAILKIAIFTIKAPPTAKPPLKQRYHRTATTMVLRPSTTKKNMNREKGRISITLMRKGGFIPVLTFRLNPQPMVILRGNMGPPGILLVKQRKRRNSTSLTRLHNININLPTLQPTLCLSPHL